LHSRTYRRAAERGEKEFWKISTKRIPKQLEKRSSKRQTPFECDSSATRKYHARRKGKEEVLS
jgi:hypothetical protein